MCVWWGWGGYYLGIPGGSEGGTRVGLDGTRGTALWLGSPVYAVWPEPGRVGTGGAPNAGEGFTGGGGPGTCALTGGRPVGGAVAEAARDAVGGLRHRQDGVG